MLLVLELVLLLVLELVLLLLLELVLLLVLELVLLVVLNTPYSFKNLKYSRKRGATAGWSSSCF